MKFVVEQGPHIRDHDNTSKIMKRLLIALLPIIVFAIYKNGIIPYQKGAVSLYEAFRPLLFILVAVITSAGSEALFARFAFKLTKEKLIKYIKHSYSIFPGLFLALILPINTPLWIVCLGSLFATFVGKMLFGGFGHNIFNPALIGSLFITTSYGSYIASRGGYLNGFELDAITKATPLTNLHSLNFLGNWNTVGAPFGSLYDYFFGFIPGALGETSKIFILLAMIYLILSKVIKWRIPVLYLSTVFVMTSIIGLTNHQELWYPLFHLFSGGLMFGAVFMATDPVTSPVTKTGQLLYGLGLGILTVTFRFLTSYPEGVLTAILTMNMLVFIIDKMGVKAKLNIKNAIVPIVTVILIMFAVTFLINNKLENKPTKNDNVNIVNIDKNGTDTTYHVTSKGFHGLITADLVFKADRLTEIKILEQYETYWQEIVNKDYINKLINAQDNISKLDTISGATVSSTALKLMVRVVLEDFESKR